MSSTHHPLGIDVGGSGIKGAPVDLDEGDFAGKRLRIDTPSRSTPDAVAEVVNEIVDHFADDTGDSPIGVTVPAVVTHGGCARPPTSTSRGSAPTPRRCSRSELGREVVVVNDADAAGVAELHYGAAKGHEGLVIMTTLGTGIGTALIYRRRAHAQLRARPPRDRRLRRRDAGRLVASRRTRACPGSEWAKRLQRYYDPIEDAALARPLRRRRRGVQGRPRSSCRC